MPVTAVLNNNLEQEVGINLAPTIHSRLVARLRFTLAEVVVIAPELVQAEVAPIGCAAPTASLHCGNKVVRFAPVKPVKSTFEGNTIGATTVRLAVGFMVLFAPFWSPVSTVVAENTYAPEADIFKVVDMVTSRVPALGKVPVLAIAVKVAVPPPGKFTVTFTVTGLAAKLCVTTAKFLMVIITVSEAV